MIDHLHDAEDDMTAPSPFPPARPDDYVHVATELSKLHRLDRRMVGRKFVDLILLASEENRPRYSATLGDERAAVFVLASPEPRETRVLHLAMGTAFAKQRLKVETAIGIATEAGFGAGRSYDTCYLKFPWKENAETDRRAAAFFSKPYSAHETEFPDKTDVKTGAPVFQ